MVSTTTKQRMGVVGRGGRCEATNVSPTVLRPFAYTYNYVLVLKFESGERTHKQKSRRYEYVSAKQTTDRQCLGAMLFMQESCAKFVIICYASWGEGGGTCLK